jgi:Flp pilus assembly protein TadG
MLKRRRRVLVSGLYSSKWARRLLLLTGQEGTELFEFALVLIVLLTLIFGVMDFSRGLYTYHYLSNAAREGTRYAIVRGSACSGFPPSECPVSAEQVEAHVKSNTPGIDPMALNVTTTWTPNNNPGSTVKVEVTYDYKFIFPLLPTTIGMKSSSQMVISQ